MSQSPPPPSNRPPPLPGRKGLPVRATEAERYASEVRRKAERMARARRQRALGWQQLAHVGSLGFSFVLPVVLGAFGGRLLERSSRVPHAGLIGLAMGLLLGAYLGGRQLHRALRDDEETSA